MNSFKKNIQSVAIANGNPGIIHGAVLVRINRTSREILSFGKFIRQGGITYDVYARIRDTRNAGKDWLPPSLIPQDPKELERQKLEAEMRQAEVDRSYASQVPRYLNEQLSLHPEIFEPVDIEYINGLIQSAESLVKSPDHRKVEVLRSQVMDFQRVLAESLESSVSQDEAVRLRNKSTVVPKTCSKKHRTQRDDCNYW